MRVSQFFFLCGTITNLWVWAIAVNSTFFSDETHVWDTCVSLKCFFFYAVHSRIYGYELLPSIQPSSRTKRMFGIHTCLSNVFFYAVHSRIYGYELLPSLVSARKVTFGSTVSCKWTRQLHHLDFINSSVRLNWGLFRHSISYMASLWRRNTTDTPTLHSPLRCCGRKENIPGSVNSLRVSEILSLAVTKYLLPLKFTGKYELTNSLLKKLEFIWPIRRLSQFCFTF